MKSILLTGAAGFIGYKTALELLSKNYYVVGVDNLNDYYDVRLKYWRLKKLDSQKNFKFYRLDIENLEDLESIFKRYKIDAIINLAARAGVSQSLKDPHIYLSTNTRGTLNILELMCKYNVLKLVLASTSSIYAGQKMPFKEDLAVNTPISPYAASKKSAELMAYAYHYLYGLDISVLRYFTVFGPCGRPDMSIFRFIKWIYEEKPIKIYGDGEQSRDFTYVDDIARGTVLALKNVGYEIINLGGGKTPYSLKKIIELLEDITQKKAHLEFLPEIKADIRATWADIEKARKILQWEPQVSLVKGLELTCKWYIENKALVVDIKI